MIKNRNEIENSLKKELKEEIKRRRRKDNRYFFKIYGAIMFPAMLLHLTVAIIAGIKNPVYYISSLTGTFTATALIITCKVLFTGSIIGSDYFSQVQDSFKTTKYIDCIENECILEGILLKLKYKYESLTIDYSLYRGNIKDIDAHLEKIKDVVDESELKELKDAMRKVGQSKIEFDYIGKVSKKDLT